MNEKNAKVYTEVLEIIKHFSAEEYSKLPKEKIEFYEKNMDKDYKFVINPDMDLEKQNISKEATAIIITLFMDYLATQEQKVKIKEILDLNQKKEEQEKREKYNPDNIFKNENKTQNNAAEISENNTNTALIEYKESFFTKLKEFIFKILHIS